MKPVSYDMTETSKTIQEIRGQIQNLRVIPLEIGNRTPMNIQNRYEEIKMRERARMAVELAMEALDRFDNLLRVHACHCEFASIDHAEEG